MNLGSRPFASPVCLLSREQGMGGWHLSPHSSVRAFHSKRLGLTRELSHLTLQMPLLGSHLHHHHCHCWHQVPSRVPCLTPTPHTLTARQYFLTGSTPGFPRQSLRHLVPSFQLWHSNTRAALAACAPIPHTPLLFLLVQWGDLFWFSLGSPEVLGDCHSPHPHGTPAPASPECI